MRDLTKELMAYREAKKADEINKRIALINRIHMYIEEIQSRSDELDTIFDNGYSASEAGIKLVDNFNSNYNYEHNNFEANGIHHRLGFLTKTNYATGVSTPWALATVGGGANGDVAIIYTDGGCVTCDYEDAAYSPSMRGSRRNPLEDMSDNWLYSCESALKKFIEDIDGFGEALETYLTRCLQTI